MIWCVEDDASIRDIEVYALQSTGFDAKGNAAEFSEFVYKEFAIHSAFPAIMK